MNITGVAKVLYKVFSKRCEVFNWSSNFIFCFNLEDKCVSTVSSLWKYLDNLKIPNMEPLWENDEEKKNQMFLITTVGFNIYAYNKIVKRWLFVFDKDTSLHLIMNHKIHVTLYCWKLFVLQNILRKTSGKKSKWFSVFKTM